MTYVFSGKFHTKTVMEIAGAEALVRQTYVDSVGVKTWGYGVTNASGHRVERYIGKPATYEKCVAVFLWLLENYAERVVAEFKGYPLTLEQFTAALSFDWNTGAIRSASWPDLLKAGKLEAAEGSFLSWNKPKEIRDRRAAEANLLFRGKWAHAGGMAPEYTRVSPKLVPVWAGRKMFDMRPYLEGKTIDV